MRRAKDQIGIFRRLVASDLEASWPRASVLRRTWYVVVDPGSRSVALVRLQGLLASVNLGPLASIVRSVNHLVSGLDWVTGAQAGPGLVIRHPSGVVVGSTVKCGSNVTLMQGVTLGQTDLHDSLESQANPQLEDRVTVGAGAVLLGGIVLGTGCTVGANAVVTRSTPPGSVVMGVPARAVSPKLTRSDPK
jgi:serine O-acetyltransferase